MMLDEPRPRQGGRDHPGTQWPASCRNRGRHHLGTVAGFKSEWTAGIAAIRTLASTLMVIWLLMRLLMLTSRLAPALAAARQSR